MPPVQPMLAKSVSGVPDPARHGGLSFEPKWDGFRCLVFKDGDEVELASRNTKPLTRYFPEVVEACRAPAARPDRARRRDLRRPPGTRRLAARVRDAAGADPPRGQPRRQAVGRDARPASWPSTCWRSATSPSWTARFAERRAALVEALGHLDGTGPCFLTRTTEDPAEAERWFEEFEGAGLDGVVAKPLGAAYEPNKRTMLKIKHERTADVVLAGYREHKTSTPEQPLIGSLLLGLYDDDGELQHIGVSASFTAAKRAELWQELQPLVCDIADHPWGRWQEFLTANPDRVPGTQSRWSAGKDLGFTALRPERVLEVKYDHMEGRRFRHTAHFKRWRTDRDPESCGYGQLDEPAGYDLTRILSTDPGGTR